MLVYPNDVYVVKYTPDFTQTLRHTAYCMFTSVPHTDALIVNIVCVDFLVYVFVFSQRSKAWQERAAAGE